LWDFLYLLINQTFNVFQIRNSPRVLAIYIAILKPYPVLAILFRRFQNSLLVGLLIFLLWAYLTKDIPKTRRASIRVAGWIEKRFNDMKEVTRSRKSTER
jgi:hypothetical protein